jgi:hypothetical protein
MSVSEPVDPFAGDPYDPARALDDGDAATVPMDPADREQVLADLVDLEVFQALLEPAGLLGLTVDCGPCQQLHCVGWDLLRSNLRALLDAGTSPVHEPAFSPDPARYVSWDYARGYADASMLERD